MERNNKNNEKKSRSKQKVAEKIQVIDDHMLCEAIIEDALYQAEVYPGMDKIDEEKQLNIHPGMVPADLDLVLTAPKLSSLILSFKNIARIENLVGFHNLTKLCLDNNYIEEIPPLDHLPSLEWLDLSFNFIRKITGLDKLKNLKDLSLYDNKIEDIGDGLQNCPNLQCLSLGRNKIKSLEQIFILRKLKNLQMLTLAENPISKEPEYRNMTIAYINSLVYLDYSFIKNEEKETAIHQYIDELRDVQEKESVVHEKEQRELAHNNYKNQLDKAGILFAYVLFDDLFADDADIVRLRHLPGVKEQIEAYNNQYKEHSEEFIKTSLERYERKKKEIENFENLINTIRKHDDYDSTQLIEEYNLFKDKKTSKITKSNEPLPYVEVQKIINELYEELDKVCDELMNIELRQVEKFSSAIDEFDTRMTEFKNESLSHQQAYFRVLEEMETKFSLQIKALAIDLIDRLSREELAEDYLDDEAMTLVLDKDTCLGVIASSNDSHQSKISKKEDEVRAMELKNFHDLISNYNNEEGSRNRKRVLQVHDFSTSVKNLLHSLLESQDDDGYDDEDHH